MTTPSPTQTRRLPHRHWLMLALALEVLWLGARGAEPFRPQPAATVDPPTIAGHIIT